MKETLDSTSVLIFGSLLTSLVKKGTFEALAHLAVTYSDGLIKASENLPKKLTTQIEQSNKPHLDYLASKEEETLVDFYTNQI